MKINNDVKSEFQMIGNQIQSITLKNNFLELPDVDELNHIMDTDYEITNIFDGGLGRIGVINLLVKAEARAKNKKKISIKIYISGVFTDYKMDNIEEFRKKLSLNGCAALYSIARAQIISLSSQAMCGGQLILPMVNFFRVREKKKRENEKEPLTEE